MGRYKDVIPLCLLARAASASWLDEAVDYGRAKSHLKSLREDKWSDIQFY